MNDKTEMQKWAESLPPFEPKEKEPNPKSDKAQALAKLAEEGKVIVLWKTAQKTASLQIPIQEFVNHSNLVVGQIVNDIVEGLE